MRIWTTAAIVVFLVGLLATGSLGASASSAPKAGGTYRVAFEQAFGFSDGFDPTGEYYTYSFAIESNLMIRTLVGYDHVAGAAGNKLVPDLATTVPAPTNGGTTYTFHLKPGVKFGPPVGRQITSKDELYSIERIANPKDGAEYAFYYSVIAGFDAYRAGKAKTISGIQTPNASTIVFHLTRPTGDFLYRLAMPATGPIPAEVAGCFEGQPGRYGTRRRLHRSLHVRGGGQGRRLLVRQAQVDERVRRPSRRLTLVRNPDYDPKTDSPAARQNFPDRFEFTVDPNSTDVVNRVAAGDLDDENGAEPALAGASVVLDRSVEAEVPAPRLRGRHAVPDDEPDPAAVRRHPRAAGDELDHRQGRAPSGLGRPDRRRRSRITSSPTRSSTTSSPSSTRTRRPVSTARSRRPRLR